MSWLIQTASCTLNKKENMITRYQRHMTIKYNRVATNKAAWHTNSHRNELKTEACIMSFLPDRLWCCYYGLHNIISNNLFVLFMYEEWYRFCHGSWLLLFPELTNHFLQVDHTWKEKWRQKTSSDFWTILTSIPY